MSYWDGNLYCVILCLEVRMGLEIKGGCLCGECRYVSHAEPINIRACHCHRCQKATAAPFYARVMVPLASISMACPIGWFNPDSGVRRGFCTPCVTTLFSARQNAKTISLPLGTTRH